MNDLLRPGRSSPHALVACLVLAAASLAFYAWSGLDLLVVGSRRYGPLRSTLLGGVSSSLVEHAHCPVLIVPRGVHAAEARDERSDAVAHV